MDLSYQMISFSVLDWNYCTETVCVNGKILVFFCFKYSNASLIGSFLTVIVSKVSFSMHADPTSFCIFDPFVYTSISESCLCYTKTWFHSACIEDYFVVTARCKHVVIVEWFHEVFQQFSCVHMDNSHEEVPQRVATSGMVISFPVIWFIKNQIPFGLLEALL